MAGLTVDLGSKTSCSRRVQFGISQHKNSSAKLTADVSLEFGNPIRHGDQ